MCSHVKAGNLSRASSVVQIILLKIVVFQGIYSENLEFFIGVDSYSRSPLSNHFFKSTTLLKSRNYIMLFSKFQRQIMPGKLMSRNCEVWPIFSPFNVFSALEGTVKI